MPSASRNSDEPRAYSRAIPLLLERLRRGGADIGALRRRLGLGTADLDDPDTSITASQYIGLWAEAARLDPAVALHIGEDYRRGDMHVVGHAAARSATLAEALACWSRYAHLLCEIDEITLEPQGSRTRLSYRSTHPAYDNPWLAEHYLAAAWRTAQTGTGRALHLAGLCFRHPRPDYAACYRELFGLDAGFDAPVNAVIFHSADLALPMRGADPYLQRFLLAEVEARDARSARHTSFERRVVEAVLRGFDQGAAPEADAVAAALGVTGSTLKRQLRQGGQGWRNLVETLRRDLAETYLRQGLSATQIAYMLGFSEPAAFQHAFQRWFGISVGGYRRALAGAGLRETAAGDSQDDPLRPA